MRCLAEVCVKLSLGAPLPQGLQRQRGTTEWRGGKLMAHFVFVTA